MTPLRDFYLNSPNFPDIKSLHNTTGLDGQSFYSPPPIFGQGAGQGIPPNTTGLDGQPFYSPPPTFGQSGSSSQQLFGGQSQSGQPQGEVDLYAKYRDPKTGEIMSPEEYATFLGERVPPQRGTIPQYAGDAMTNPDESAESLTARARTMANERNDIATGAADPYGVASGSGIAYSPQELQAIEKAYAGIYDPALNDVFARLQKREEEKRRQEAREDKIFATNEQIRAWHATTGTRSSVDDDIFTDANIKTGASRAKMSIEEFQKLDPDIKNYFVNPPKAWSEELGKYVLISEMIDEAIRRIKSGKTTVEEAIERIDAGDLPDAVKAYLIEQLPGGADAKENWWKRLWGGVKGFFQ